MPHSPTNPPVAPKNTQPTANTAAGSTVTTANSPSRDSHDERHCDSARSARSGRPRCSADEASPPAASSAASTRLSTANPGLSGTRPRGAPIPSSSSSANPAPEAVVKKMIDKAGCMVSATALCRSSATAGRRARAARRRAPPPAAGQRRAPRAAAVGDHLRYRRIGVAEIAEMPRLGRAHHDAGRQALFGGEVVVIDAVDAQGAFLHHPFVLVELAGAVGTGPGAQFAADADLGVDQDDAVFGALVGSPGRAHGDAGGLGAMQAR